MEIENIWNVIWLSWHWNVPAFQIKKKKKTKMKCIQAHDRFDAYPDMP